MQQNLIQVTARSLGYELPHGDILFQDLNFSWQFRRCALVGPNGVGKSTLAHILSGKKSYSQGDLICSAQVIYLEQWQLAPDLTTVAEYLSDLWESPTADPLVWGPLLSGTPMEAPLTSLSGGQWTRVRIAQALAAAQELLILDEPTNNLDRDARKVIVEFVKGYPGDLLLISHDRELLNEVDGIWELSSQGLQSYGGNFAFYEKEKAHERDLLEDRLERARKEKKKLEREHHEKNESQEKRMRQGQTQADRGGIPKILLGARKRRAQQMQGRINSLETQRVEKSEEQLRDLAAQQKVESQLNPLMISTSVPEGKRIVECRDFNIRYGAGEPLWKQRLTLSLKGAGRWALRGANGSGKSSLIKVLMNQQPAELTTVGDFFRADISTAYLDQEYSLLDFDQTVFDNVMSTSRYDAIETRNLLARFQFMKESVQQKVETLSGGEKLKAALAKIFLMNPAAQFLILDEPTNNLDLSSLEILEDILLSYRGALLVVSHDEVFLDNIGVDQYLDLQRQ